MDSTRQLLVIVSIRTQCSAEQGTILKKRVPLQEGLGSRD